MYENVEQKRSERDFLIPSTAHFNTFVYAWFDDLVHKWVERVYLKKASKIVKLNILHFH